MLISVLKKNNSSWIFIGIVEKNWQGYTDQSSGYVGYSPISWSYGNANNWGKTSSGSGQQYGLPYTTGDVVSIILDMDASSLSFGLNGKDLGICFQNFATEVKIAVTLYQPGDQIKLLTDGSHIIDKKSSKDSSVWKFGNRNRK